MENTPFATNQYCTNCGNSVSKYAVACLSCGANPIAHKKNCRHCGVALNPEQVICIKCGAGIAGALNPYGAINPPSNADIAEKLNTYFTAFWICMVVGFSLCFVIVGLPVVIVSVIYWNMLLYQLWKLIPADIARTTPGKAVGFQFIPIFWFYWYFVAYWGLCQDMNETLKQRGIQHRVSEGLGLTYSISCVACWITMFIPYVDIVVSIVALVICIFFTKSVKYGGIALLEQK